MENKQKEAGQEKVEHIGPDLPIRDEPMASVRGKLPA
jgi:hypothetical protein